MPSSRPLRNAEPWRFERALLYRTAPRDPERDHGPLPDHLGPAVHQRHQAPRQPGRVDAAGRRARPLPSGPGPRGALHLRHRRARHPGRTGRCGRWPGCACLLRRAAHRPEDRRRGVRPVDGLVRAVLEPAQPPAYAALLRGAGGQRADRRASGPDGLLGRRQEVPARPLCPGHLPPLWLRARARRPVRQLRPPAGSHRPEGALFGHLRLQEHRGPRHAAPVSAASQDAGSHPRLGEREVGRLAQPDQGHRQQVPRRRADRPRHNPRPSLGHPGHQGRRAPSGLRGQGLLCLVRRADRIHRRHGRMVGSDRQ